MQGEITEKTKSVGALKKRRVVMADGKRYLIYYTFENNVPENLTENKPPEAEARNSTIEEEEINV